MKYFFPYFVLVLLSLASFSSQAGYATNGVLDLRYESFDEPIALSGEWEVYWERFIRPHEFFSGDEMTYFPALWKGQIVGEDTLTSEGYATYRLKLLLPDKPFHYQLFIDDMYSAYQLYIDGELVAANGTVGKSKNEENPQWLPMVIDLPRLMGASEVVLHISNWQHAKGGNANDLLLGVSDELSDKFDRAILVNAILFFIFVAVGLFFLIRFVAHSYDLASFYFGLFCLIYGYRIIATDLYVLHQFLPDFSWEVSIHLEYLTLFVSTLLLAMYVRRLFFQLVNPVAFWVLLIIGGFCFLLTIVSPISVFTALVVPFFVVIVLYMNYGFYIYTLAAVNDVPGTIYGLISVAVVFAIFLYQIFYYFGWLDYLYEVTFVGHIIFLVLQAIQLYIHSENKRTQVIAIA